MRGRSVPADAGPLHAGRAPGSQSKISILEMLRQLPVLPPAEGRIRAVDLARGVAIALMIVSHSVSGLMWIRNVPAWGMVPIHLLTKFSSSLFIVVFGIGLAVAFLPKTGEPDWPGRRKQLIWRGIDVFIAYKVLTVIEMMPTFPAADILDALLYQRFPIWVDILGFYAIALLWLPWVLPLWRRMPLWSRLLAPVAIALFSGWLERNCGFFGNPALKAILVEDADYYSWGQIARLPLVLLGLLIGELLLRTYRSPATRRILVLVLSAGGASMLLVFTAISLPDMGGALTAVAWNTGKHPPAVPFMLFSLGGALLILALCLGGGETGARRATPITIIGSEPLLAFSFHIVMIFLVFRFFLQDLIAYSYPQVLVIGIALVPATAAWIAFTQWMKAHRRKK